MHELQMKYRVQIERIAAASRRLSELGYVASHGGNLSERIEDRLILITPTKVAKREVVFEDICVVDMEGKTLFAPEGRRPTGEVPMHTHIYQKRPDVASVIHSHAPVLTGFAIAHSDILSHAILPEPILEIGPVLSIAYEEPLTQKLADAMDDVIDKTNAFLMKNHGVTVMCADTVLRALDLTEMLEKMANSVLVAMQLGQVKFIPEEEIENLDHVCRVRDLPLPGRKGKFASVLEAYKMK